MRIISGIHKGRRIQAPKKLPIRPTTDMAKEALFNILRNLVHINDLKVLELFAGSGNMSYEFASRGARFVLAVDSHMPCVAFIKKTAELLELPIDTVKADVFSFLTNHQGNYDIVFADPPYDLEYNQFMELVNLIIDKNILNEDGLLIVEHSKHTDLSSHSAFDNERKYGGTVFSFFKTTSSSEEE